MSVFPSGYLGLAKPRSVLTELEEKVFAPCYNKPLTGKGDVYFRPKPCLSLWKKGGKPPSSYSVETHYSNRHIRHVYYSFIFILIIFHFYLFIYYFLNVFYATCRYFIGALKGSRRFGFRVRS